MTAVAPNPSTCAARLARKHFELQLPVRHHLKESASLHISIDGPRFDVRRKRPANPGLPRGLQHIVKRNQVPLAEAAGHRDLRWIGVARDAELLRLPAEVTDGHAGLRRIDVVRHQRTMSPEVVRRRRLHEAAIENVPVTFTRDRWSRRVRGERRGSAAHRRRTLAIHSKARARPNVADWHRSHGKPVLPHRKAATGLHVWGLRFSACRKALSCGPAFGVTR